MKTLKTKKPDVNDTLRTDGADAVRARHDKAHRKQTAAALLDDVRKFLGRFVSYPSGHASVAHTLWVPHCHLMRAWESTPRLAFLSPEPECGKSRALEVTELLVPNPINVTNVSPAYLFRKCGDEESGPPSILFDEIDALFGPKVKNEHEDVRSFLNSGHRRGATFGRCVVRGKTVETEEIESFAAVALAGRRLRCRAESVACGARRRSVPGLPARRACRRLAALFAASLSVPSGGRHRRHRRHKRCSPPLL
ncbi:hypothetical protein AB7M17_003954 [Bradyrhizobium sp. USDA 377]